MYSLYFSMTRPHTAQKTKKKSSKKSKMRKIPTNSHRFLQIPTHFHKFLQIPTNFHFIPRNFFLLFLNSLNLLLRGKRFKLLEKSFDIFSLVQKEEHQTERSLPP